MYLFAKKKGDREIQYTVYTSKAGSNLSDER
jgi:hypothetical protein